jgi:4-hydroxybenzoate polyprenyltransferase
MNGAAASTYPVWLRLGRVSNLPTVLSNTLAAGLLGSAGSGTPPDAERLLAMMLAMCLFYVGGMYLNDAFDRHIDARERPHRPIPSGQAGAATVFVLGFSMLGLGCVLVAAAAGPVSIVLGTLLAANIVLYNVWHKGNPCSPLLMGGCRALLYLCVGSAFASGTTPLLLLASGLMLAHIVGLTHAAKQESLNRLESVWPLLVLALPPLAYVLLAAIPGLSGPMGLSAQGAARSAPTLIVQAAMLLVLIAADVQAVKTLALRAKAGAVGAAVAQLIACSSLVDGLAIAACAPAWLFSAGPACVAAYVATRQLQRVIPGT